MQKHKPKILVATDDIEVQAALSALFQAEEYDSECVTTVEAALSELAARPFDLILADVRLPGRPLEDLLQQILEFHPEVVAVMIVAPDGIEAAVEYASLGVYDHIVRPLNPRLALRCVGRALEKKLLAAQNREFQSYLAQMVEERAAETQRILYGVTQVLIRLLELRVPLDAGHAVNVAEISRRIARALKMTAAGVHRVYLAALLHDVGMIPVRDFLLNKRGRLTPEEYRQIQEHTSLAEAVLKPVVDDAEVLQYIRHHHEWYDGAGYPDGLRGNIIPLGARIIAVAEAFDSMIRNRPHRKALSDDVALARLRQNADTQFDRKVVSAFLELADELPAFLRKPPASEP